MRMVDPSPEAGALHAAALDCSNGLYDLSIEVGALTGLLKLIAGNSDLEEQQSFALDKLASMAQGIENTMAALMDGLNGVLTEP